ncbi:MAG: hypothetical protein DCF32_15400 [Leptolyngbya sp.]|nr:MAG: hypothetical protein DCF32_15400 [Leptolyngbya sp.]
MAKTSAAKFLRGRLTRANLTGTPLVNAVLSRKNLTQATLH